MRITYQNIKFFIVLLFLPAICCSWPWSNDPVNTNIKYPPYGDPIVVNIQSPYSTGTTNAHVAIGHKSIFPPIPKMPDRTTLSNYWNISYKTFKNNIFKITLGTIFASYAWIAYQIRQTNLLIKKHDAWCNWKSVVPITHLQLATQEDLLAQLKIDLYKKYSLAASNASTCDYTFMFVNEIKNEMALFDAYLRWLHMIKAISCNRFFHFSHDETVIEEKKARLLFLLDLFMTWYSQNNTIVVKIT
ncbi:hypothetical protein A3J41_01720 [candidate division TM6 bacterium RIFCSPHIGHO2_12_FULL_38_8]|nr:MAG: hypothetical protein A3J41_01720 [candidate division TM6 bacterium RIFCSPHIGHO2_12_FULL_38_8]